MIEIEDDYRGGVNLLLHKATNKDRKELAERIDRISDSLKYVIDRGDWIKLIPKRGVTSVEIVAELCK